MADYGNMQQVYIIKYYMFIIFEWFFFQNDLTQMTVKTYKLNIFVCNSSAYYLPVYNLTKLDGYNLYIYVSNTVYT